MTDKQTPPDWVLIEAAKRSGASRELDTLRRFYEITGSFRALCDTIAKYEQPPVDRKLLCVREAMAEEAEAATLPKWAAKFRSGEYDATDHITVPFRAIELWEEGFGK